MREKVAREEVLAGEDEDGGGCCWLDENAPEVGHGTVQVRTYGLNNRTARTKRLGLIFVIQWPIHGGPTKTLGKAKQRMSLKVICDDEYGSETETNVASLDNVSDGQDEELIKVRKQCINKKAKMSQTEDRVEERV
ncbi:hypothetical protein LguiA_036287 [Lonicera macranthoides]